MILRMSFLEFESHRYNYGSRCGRRPTPPTIKLTTFLDSFVYEFWNGKVVIIWRRFPPIFAILKLTCLVTLFDRNLQLFKNSLKWIIFDIFNELLSSQNVNVVRFARNLECDFFFDFQTLCMLSWFLIFPYLVLTIFTLILIHFGYILIHFWHENSNI